MQCQGNIRDQRSNFLRQRQLLIQGLLEIHGRKSEIVLQYEVVEVQDFPETRGEAVPLEQVGDAHGTAGYLVFIGGADAASGGADRVGAARNLASLVELDMRRQDQRAVR